MNLQIIKSMDGKAEYVLLPIKAYEVLRHEIERALADNKDEEPFHLEDYISNPIALARIKADLTQEELAGKLGVSQAYISKLESAQEVSAKILHRVMAAIKGR